MSGRIVGVDGGGSDFAMACPCPSTTGGLHAGLGNFPSTLVRAVRQASNKRQDGALATSTSRAARRHRRC